MPATFNRAELSVVERNLRSRLAQLASGAWLLRGAISERSGKCGKPNCRCAKGELHHSVYLVQSQAGKVRQMCVPKGLQDPVRRAVGNCQEVQRLIEAISELEWKRLLARKT